MRRRWSETAGDGGMRLEVGREVGESQPAWAGSPCTNAIQWGGQRGSPKGTEQTEPAQVRSRGVAAGLTSAPQALAVSAEPTTCPL